jgi:hypothetical protein
MSLWLDDMPPGLLLLCECRKTITQNEFAMKNIGKSAVIFIGLAVVFGALVLVANTLANTFSQSLLVSLGSAVFGSGLTFFLIRVSDLGDSK